MCFSVYTDCRSSNYDHNRSWEELLYSCYIALELAKSQLSPNLKPEQRARLIVQNARFLLSLYDGTELSFINETCLFADVYPTLPPAAKMINVIYTNCMIDLLRKGLVMDLYYEETLSNISGIKYR